MFLYNNNYITWFSSWILIGFTMESIGLIIRGSFVNLCIYNFFLFHDFFTLTIFTFVFFVDHFTFTTTVITRSGRLSIHTRSELLHSSYHTTTFTSCTFLDGTFFSTFTLTWLTNAFTIHCNFCLFSNHYLFEGNFKRMLHGFHFFWAFLLTTTSTAKHLT